MLIHTHANIAEVTADIIVNAANAVGYMGGWLGGHVRLRGVAESIHYATKGSVEQEARMIVRRDRPGLGEVYVTGAYNLPARWIVHAATMMKPGSRSSIGVVEWCADNIIDISRVLGAKAARNGRRRRRKGTGGSGVSCKVRRRCGSGHYRCSVPLIKCRKNGATVTKIFATMEWKEVISVVDKQAMEQRARALQIELGGIIFAFPIEPDDPQSQYAVATLFGGGCVVFPDPLDIGDAAFLLGTIIETVKEEKYPFKYARDVKFVAFEPQANAPNVTMRRLRRFTIIPPKGS